MKVKSNADKAWDMVFVIFCLIISAMCVIPMLNLLAKSLSGTDFLVRNEVYLIPKGFNFNAYSTVLKDPKYIRAFVWTVFLTVVCTVLSLTMTTLCAFPLILKTFAEEKQSTSSLQSRCFSMQEQSRTTC